VEYIKTTDQLQKNERNLNSTYFTIDKNGLLRFKNILYIPNSVELKIRILNELHKNPYSSHPRYQKTITTQIKWFYLPNIKYKTNEYLSKCLDCQ
jgi:hypothetical protein